MICTTLCAGHGDSVGSAYVAVETLWCRRTAVRTLRCQRVAVGTRTARPPPGPSEVTAMAAAAPRLAGPQRACATGPPARSLPLGAPSSPLLSSPSRAAPRPAPAEPCARRGEGRGRPREGRRGGARGRGGERSRAEPRRAELAVAPASTAAMLDPSSSEEESEELVEEESGKEPLAPAAARLSPSRPGESPGPGGGGGGGGGLQPGGRAGGAARPASPSPSVASEKEKDELERLQREEEERKRKLQLYVFVMRCIAYPFNAKQPTDMARRQQKVPRCRPALPVLLPLPFAAPCPRRPPAPRLPAPPPARSRSRPRRLPGAPRAVPARGTLAPCGLRVGPVPVRGSAAAQAPLVVMQYGNRGCPGFWPAGGC